MTYKAHSLAIAILCASLCSVPALAKPLACKDGTKAVTVAQIIVGVKLGPVLVTYIVNDTREQRMIQYTTDEIRMKKIAVGVEFCMDETEM